MISRVYAQINLTALEHNFQIVKQLAPGSAVLAMVKSNAYGHGLIPVARTLRKADGFGAANLEEAVQLRNANICQKIVLMSGFIYPDELESIVEYDLDVVIHDIEQIAMLERAQITKPLNVWLKVDTGMHRLGFMSEIFDKSYKRIKACPNVANIYLLTHLASANAITNPVTEAQIQLFERTVGDFSEKKSVANSAGIIAWPASHFDWVRPGILLYGVSPLLNKTGRHHNLRPVMTLGSRLIAIHQLHKGDLIGYGGNWQCQDDMPVGVVAIGYGDGYPRHAKNGTPVLINNTLCPLVGRVSMDMITIDLRPCAKAKIGDKVILWGEGLPVEKVAQSADTIGYELLTRVSPRISDIEYSHE